jgi:hypothetical protein
VSDGRGIRVCVQRLALTVGVPLLALLAVGAAAAIARAFMLRRSQREAPFR